MRKVSSQTKSGTPSIVKGFLYSTAVAALVISAPAQANDMDEMRTELQSLLDRMERIEQTQTEQQIAVEAAAPVLQNQYIRERSPLMRGYFAPQSAWDGYIKPETARGNQVVGGDLPGSFKVPGTDTSMSITGGMQLGVNYDGGQSEGAFATWGHAGLLQADGAGSNGAGALRFESLNNSNAISTSTETEMGTVSTLMLWSWTQTAPALESLLNQAQAEQIAASFTLGNWSFGEQNQAYTSGNCYGETVYTGGAPCPLGRGPSIQYRGGGGGMNYVFELVHPATSLDADGLADVAGSNVNGSIPDVQARISSGMGGAMASVGLQMNNLKYESKAGTPSTFNAGDSETGWGIFPEIKVPMGKDTFYAGVSYTDGGRQTNINHNLWTGGRGEEGIINPTTGSIETTVVVSAHMYYTHWWNDTFRSTLNVHGANANVSDLSVGATGTTPPLTKWRTVSGNVVWSLVPRVTTGLGVTYHTSLFRGDQGNANATSDEATTAVEGNWTIKVSY